MSLLATTILFVATTLLTALLLYKASGNSSVLGWVITGWIALQGIMAISGFYQNTATIPPRFSLLLLPPLALIIFLFSTRWGRQQINGYNTKTLTWLHAVRVPVEIVLYGLFLNKFVPELMTFAGRNFDIASGVTAPVIALWGYHYKRFGNRLLISWNIICLLLLVNIVTHAILAAPTPFQQLAFDQPNIGVMHFPFVWLPCFIVPVVLFSHLVCLRELLTKDPVLVS